MLELLLEVVVEVAACVNVFLYLGELKLEFAALLIGCIEGIGALFQCQP